MTEITYISPMKISVPEIYQFEIFGRASFWVHVIYCVYFLSWNCKKTPTAVHSQTV